MPTSSENKSPSEETLKWTKRSFYVSLATLVVITIAVVIIIIFGEAHTA